MGNPRQQTEEIILAQWLHGENLADINLIETSDFGAYPNVVGYIKQNGIKAFHRDAFTKGLMTKEDYNRIHGEYFPDLYETHFSGMLKNSVYRWIGNHRTASAEEMIQRLSVITGRVVDIPTPCSDPGTMLIDTFDRRANAEIIRTRLNGLDKYLYGVRTGELTFVGARPSVGKSAFCLQMAEEVAVQGKRVVYLSLEMSETSMWERILLRHCDIPIGHIRQGLTQTDWANANPALDWIDKLHKSGNFILIPNAREISVSTGKVWTKSPIEVVFTIRTRCTGRFAKACKKG